MSVVTGVRFKGGVILAGDAQWSDENSNRIGAQSKVHALMDTLAIGYVGSARLGQILQYQLAELEDPFLPREGRDEEYWMVREFIPFLRRVTDDEGHLHIKHNAEYLGESAFLCAVRGRLFLVSEDFSVSEHSLPYEAVGSGEDNAISALYTTLGKKVKPATITEEKAVDSAVAGVEAAVTFNNYVGGEIKYVQTSLYSPEEIETAKRILGRA